MPKLKEKERKPHPEGEKKCKGCGLSKPYPEFFRDSARKDGYTSYCKACWKVGKKYSKNNDGTCPNREDKGKCERGCVNTCRLFLAERVYKKGEEQRASRITRLSTVINRGKRRYQRSASVFSAAVEFENELTDDQYAELGGRNHLLGKVDPDTKILIYQAQRRLERRHIGKTRPRSHYFYKLKNNVKSKGFDFKLNCQVWKEMWTTLEKLIPNAWGLRSKRRVPEVGEISGGRISIDRGFYPDNYHLYTVNEEGEIISLITYEEVMNVQHTED